jgi:ribosomal-protein-alanine N-acetyltransferase
MIRMIFQTTRLSIRKLTELDTDNFFDMMGNSKVMNPVPRTAMTRAESDAKLALLIELEPNSSTTVWAMTVKGNDEFIGLCGFLKNDENQDELAYRLREKYWGVGYGTEVAKGLLTYGFEEKNFPVIIGDVYIENIPSIKILEKFMTAGTEFFNESDQCMDRRYTVSKTEFLNS